jgi:hypothetical protein
MELVRTLLGRLLDVLTSARQVAAAVEVRRTPREADLRRLGIDPAAFTSIGHG